MHPADSASHELNLTCDDVKAFVAEMKKRGVACSEVHEERWGSLVRLTLPSGTELGVYQPKHASPKWGATKRASAPKKKSVAKKKPAKKGRR